MLAPSNILMENDFLNFDDEVVYKDSQIKALKPSTRNFVVKFGKRECQIAFDLRKDVVKQFLGVKDSVELPVTWINIWAPHLEQGLVELIGAHYKFSARLLAIIKSVPPRENHSRPRPGRINSKFCNGDDIEPGNANLERPPRTSTPHRVSPDQTSHYIFARQMVNYQSIDVGPHFLCVGANWLHELNSARDEDEIYVDEGNQRRLWSWLIVCDDNTVISIHEGAGSLPESDMKSMRSNTLSVLRQLSKFGHESATDPIFIQTVRQALESNQADTGNEGASNLFFYLFDDWRAVYQVVAGFHKRLGQFQSEILGDMDHRTSSTPKINIIPRLHDLGREIRQMQHLYQGYQRLIKRILEHSLPDMDGTAKPSSLGDIRNMSREDSHLNGVSLTPSACQRFARLCDRLELMILSETKEFLAEKEALISTYFNINAQKDSEATARLTRSATLLAKLSVFFLPVSLLTSYYSIQFDQKRKQVIYWEAFTGICILSFASLFFFTRLLITIRGILAALVKKLAHACSRLCGKKQGRGEDCHELARIDRSLNAGD